MDPVKAIAAITGRVLRHIADAIDNTDWSVPAKVATAIKRRVVYVSES